MLFECIEISNQNGSIKRLAIIKGDNRDHAIDNHKIKTGEDWPLDVCYKVIPLSDKNKSKLKKSLKKKLKKVSSLFGFFEYHTSDEDIGQTELEDKDWCYDRKIALEYKEKYSKKVKKIKKQLKLLK